MRNPAIKHPAKPEAKIVGIIVPHIPGIFYSSYYANILAGTADFLLDAGCGLKLIFIKPGNKKLDGFDFKAQEGVDGLVVTNWFKFFSGKAIGKSLSVPAVFINDFDAAVKTCFVCEDGVAGGRLAAEYFYRMGHRRPAIITGPKWSRDSRCRVKGFIESCENRGVPVSRDLIFEGDFDEAPAAYKAVDKIRAKDKKATAIFCCNDNIAFNVIRRYKALGLSCPEDISVIGYDDARAAADFDPPVTTIRVPVYDLAQKATAFLLKHLKGDISRSEFFSSNYLPVQFIERGSVRKISV